MTQEQTTAPQVPQQSPFSSYEEIIERLKISVLLKTVSSKNPNVFIIIFSDGTQANITTETRDKLVNAVVNDYTIVDASPVVRLSAKQQFALNDRVNRYLLSRFHDPILAI